MSLTAQEVRNAVIGGDLNKLIKELNIQTIWLKLNNRTVSEERGRDVELILRLLALEDRFESYRKPMNSYLNSYLRDNKVLSPNDLALIESKFVDTINVIDANLGDNAF